MMEQFLRLVEQQAKQPIVENQQIPNQFNQAVIREVSSQIFNSLKSQVNQGNMQQVIALFQSGGKNVQQHPIVSTVIQSVSGTIASKFTLNQEVANQVAKTLVPQVVNQIIQRSNDPRDIDFDLQQMMRSMSGNSSLDISSMLNQQAQRGALSSFSSVVGKLFGR